MNQPGRRDRSKPIEDADEFMRVLDEVASAPEAWNTFISTGNAAAGWEAYRRSRAGGGKPPEAVLAWLDRVAEAVLQSNGEPEAVLAAMECPRPERGGPGPVSRLAKQLETQALCSAVWLAATGGRYSPGDAPPREGVAQALRQVAAERSISVAALERRWHRWAKAADRAPISGAELQRLLSMR